jgi:hypothetical protein
MMGFRYWWLVQSRRTRAVLLLSALLAVEVALTLAAPAAEPLLAFAVRLTPGPVHALIERIVMGAAFLGFVTAGALVAVGLSWMRELWKEEDDGNV